MEVCGRPSWLSLLLAVFLLAFSLQGVQGEAEGEVGGPSESECRPYIEKALKELEVGEEDDETLSSNNDDSKEDLPTIEITTDNSDHPLGNDSDENDSGHIEDTNDRNVSNDADDNNDDDNDDHNKSEDETTNNSKENDEDRIRDGSNDESEENAIDSKENANDSDEKSEEAVNNREEDKSDEIENVAQHVDVVEQEPESNESQPEPEPEKSAEEDDPKESDEKDSNEATPTSQESGEQNDGKSDEQTDHSKEHDSKEESKEEGDSGEVGKNENESDENTTEESIVEELTDEYDEYKGERRTREHVEHLLKLDENYTDAAVIINRIAEITLRELKKLYENAIQPLETLYKYRDLSNRHFGDSEIYSKPLILFMGPWSGGKSTIINYLVNNEYTETSLRTGAEPSPAYFNILMWGNESEVLDGTELAADYTFSGLQKFGQGLEERLRGYKLPMKLLEKVNIVEIPGILEVRKQVSRVFPFNDACQWFIDRADVIFLVYDPSKLDVGPETEAILDQLKGREQHTRIVLNKADQVKPEELMRVQGALIWNISPLMSSPQPPIMYTTSLWSRPYEPWAPVRLLNAQERAFLRDIRTMIEKRIENKIASARRFAVRVRNHAKMVDCYLTTYYNHKTVFGNKKQIANEIIENPQDYHIYEGLSTLTNISRYDLPDPDVYREFFKLNPLYEFQQLSATCTYFRGCPINRLDIAIAYDLPELVGKHKRLLEAALNEATTTAPGS